MSRVLPRRPLLVALAALLAAGAAGCRGNVGRRIPPGGLHAGGTHARVVRDAPASPEGDPTYATPPSYEPMPPDGPVAHDDTPVLYPSADGSPVPVPAGRWPVAPGVLAPDPGSELPTFDGPAATPTPDGPVPEPGSELPVFGAPGAAPSPAPTQPTETAPFTPGPPSPSGPTSRAADPRGDLPPPPPPGALPDSDTPEGRVALAPLPGPEEEAAASPAPTPAPAPVRPPEPVRPPPLAPVAPREPIPAPAAPPAAPEQVVPAPPPTPAPPAPPARPAPDSDFPDVAEPAPDREPAPRAPDVAPPPSAKGRDDFAFGAGRERRVMEHVAALRAHPEEARPCWPAELAKTVPAATALENGTRPVLIVVYDDTSRASRLGAADLWPVVLEIESRIDLVLLDLTPGRKATKDEEKLVNRYYNGYVPATVLLGSNRVKVLLWKDLRVEPSVLREKAAVAR